MEGKRTKPDSGVCVSLPEDVVFEVLARLPAKTLCRFRCVCKGWCALISNPAFVAAQRSRAGPHLVGVFYEAWPPEVVVMDMDGNLVRSLEMSKSTPLPTPLMAADLICVQENQLLPEKGGMVIDPAAGRAFTISSAADPPAPPGFTYSTSFGRAAPSGAFKFVRLLEQWNGDGGGGHSLCEVATIIDGGGTGPLTWRRRSASPFVTGPGCDQMAIVNGFLYWISCKLEIGGDDGDGEDDTAPSCRSRIAAFDLEREEWKPDVIHGPTLRHHKEGETWCIALVEIRGTLALVDAHMDNGQDVSIWLLVDPEKSVWVKECTIQVPDKYTWNTKVLGDVLGDGGMLLLVKSLEIVETIQNNNSSDY